MNEGAIAGGKHVKGVVHEAAEEMEMADDR